MLMNRPSQAEIDDQAVVDICVLGAEAHRKDSNILPQFDIVSSEIQLVRSYMSEHYPEVPYRMTYPSGGDK